MKIIHPLFPTLLLEFDCSPKEHEEIKNAYLWAVDKLVDESGVSNELTGHVDLHNVKEFSSLMQFIGRSTRTFISTYNVKEDLFEVNAVKTFFNISKESGNPPHHHRDAHISWVYYINVPADQHRKIFFHNDRRHEPYEGFNDVNVDGSWHEFNSKTWSFVPREGMLLMWPASMVHSVEGPNIVEGIKTAPQEKLRVSVVGDLLLTYKQKEARCLGLQPQNSWRKLT